MDDSKKTDLRRLQEIDLNIAKEFARICDEHNLKYFMLGGTMLGAVRHKGFIPWDDDMDFALFRDDYEKFLEIAPKELPVYMKVVEYKNSSTHQTYNVKIYDTDTKIIETRIGNENSNTHASIDIFPVDGSPNSSILRQIYIYRVLFHHALLTLCFKDSLDRKRKRNCIEKILLSVMERMPIEKWTTPYKQNLKIDNLMKKHKVDGSKYIGNLMGYYRAKELMPSDVYGEGIMYPFEDAKFRGVTKYDEYLTLQYGDYMQLPPEEERERKSHYKIIELHGEKIAEDF